MERLGTEEGSSNIPVQAAALVIDAAKKVGKSIGDYMKEKGFSKEDITMIVKLSSDADSGKRDLGKW